MITVTAATDTATRPTVTGGPTRPTRGPGDELAPTPGQTVGPFFHTALPYEGDSHLVPPGSPGAVWLRGRVFDGAGVPVPDALLEVWQADPHGVVPQTSGSLRRDGFTFTGFGRAATDAEGRYSFSTVPAGAAGRAAGGGAPFYAVTVFARGLLDRLLTRAYLPGGGDDRLLRSLTPEQRATLVCTADADGFVFDVHLQGPRETVFLTHG